MSPHSSVLTWRSHGQRSLAGYSPWGCPESNTTERAHTHSPLDMQEDRSTVASKAHLLGLWDPRGQFT